MEKYKKKRFREVSKPLGSIFLYSLFSETMASIEVCLDKINELAEFAGLTSVLLKEQTTKLQKSIQDLEKSAEKSNLLKLNADLENKLFDQIAESNKARSELVDLKFQTQGNFIIRLFNFDL